MNILPAAGAMLPPAMGAAPVPPAILTVANALIVCGFTQAEANVLTAEAFPNWDAFIRMTEKDISNMSDEYAKRTIAQNKIQFGFYRTKQLQGLMHWVQDCGRTDREPRAQQINANDIADAAVNANHRLNLKDNMETASKATDPGKLKANTDWYTWSQGFNNYLSTIPGSTGIPLSYVIRINENPMIVHDVDYLTDLVNRAPLRGPVFTADRRQVHQLLTGKILGEQSEEWVRSNKAKMNGRTDFITLRIHYEGEGNINRRITKAEAIRKTLHYKQERSLKFTTFLNQLQVMYEIYEASGDPHSEKAKLRFLFERIQAPHLSQAITNLRFQMDLGGLTYETAKNHLMSIVQGTTDYHHNEQRGVSSTNTESSNKFTKNSSFKGKKHVKGKVPLGDKHISRDVWFKLTKEQQATIRKYRTDNGLPAVELAR
jgi:hypothetical protein